MALDVAIIGSGFGGMGAAIRLRKAGITNIAIFERATDVGGTWRDNQYPGCRCDVASNLYLFSFAQNPSWTNSFSFQPEIWRYLQNVADKFNLRPLIKFNHDVNDISFNHESKLWTVSTNHGATEACSVILATGGLAEPRLPDIAGIDSFAGPMMHTSRWDSSVDLAGKHVGIIGTGASAVQVIPEIAPIVGHLDVFQRNAVWVVPHLGHPVKERTRRLFRLLPFAQRLERFYEYWTRELRVLAFVKDPSKMEKAENGSKMFLAAQVPNAELRAKLTPNYRIGCKRITISNTYYPTFNRENVQLTTEGISAIEPTGIRTNDGQLHELDVLILATGFYVAENPMGEKVHGVNGETLSASFAGDLPNYKGTSFPDFPNFFMLGGPNTSLGHSSIVFMHESQLNYVVKTLKFALRKSALVEPTLHASKQWSDEIEAKTKTTIWGTGCTSWYLNKNGQNTVVWPDFTFKFRKATRRFEKTDHQITL